MITKLKNRTAAVVMLALSTACSIIPDGEPVQLLDPRVPQPSGSSRSADWSLNVARPESDPARDSNRVLVRTGAGQLQVHPSARWVAAAPELLRTRLIRYLRDSGSIARVGAGAAGLDRTLALDLRRFELIETGDGRLEARIEFEARLFDSGSARLIARELFDAHRPVAGTGPDAIVAGFEAVLGDLVPAAAAWLMR